MDKPGSSPDYSYVVYSRRQSGAVTHTISCFASQEVVEDEVRAENGCVLRQVRQTPDCREETEFDQHGRVIVTRHVRPWGNSATAITEVAHGCFKVERTTILSPYGKPVKVSETLWEADFPQTQAETSFKEDGSPAATVTTFLSKLGKMTRKDETVWHAASRPAITETTEYDWTGAASQHVKTVHSPAGMPLWQEKTVFPSNSAKPCKKEVFLFNAQATPSVVDVAEYGEAGIVAQHVVECHPAPPQAKLPTE